MPRLVEARGSRISPRPAPAPATNHRVVDIGAGHNLKTGYAVTYDNGGGATMGGLSNGQTYYVIILKDDRAELAATREDALAGKAISLTDDGNTSQKLVDGTASFRAEATSGAGGGDIGVAGSVAINIANTDTRAIISYDADPIVGSPNLAATQLTLTGGNVDIKAENLTESFVTAAPSGTF